jgi:asparagine synthase (glutamine-hydrolysing)
MMTRPWWFLRRLIRRGTFTSLGVLRQIPDDWRAGLEAEEQAAKLPGRSKLQVAQAADCAHWLPNDLLIKLDRCLMANQLEGRTPFLDPEMAKFAFTLPTT